MIDALIIGAGLAGLTAAWQAAQRGKKVRVVAKGWGATHWHAGCIDVLGYYPLDHHEPVANPTAGIEQLLADLPQHPYGLVGQATLAAALEAFQELCAAAGYPLSGSLDKNWSLPSAAGVGRPTCLAPDTMIAGDLSQNSSMLLVGFEGYNDFYPHLAADNLIKAGHDAHHVMVNLPTLRARTFLTPVKVAQFLDQPGFRQELITAVQPYVGQADRIGFPAVLGLDQAPVVKQELESAFDRPVFELPGLPPSVPGMRLQRILYKAIQMLGGRVYDGMEALRADMDDGQVKAVYTEAAARPRPHRAGNYVLATGGILGGGITTKMSGEVKEVIFGLPVTAPQDRKAWFNRRFLSEDSHPVFQAGIAVDQNLQPVNGQPQPLYKNLYAAGTTLAHCEPIRERSFEGIALATGYQVGQLID